VRTNPESDHRPCLPRVISKLILVSPKIKFQTRMVASRVRMLYRHARLAATATLKVECNLSQAGTLGLWVLSCISFWGTFCIFFESLNFVSVRPHFLYKRRIEKSCDGRSKYSTAVSLPLSNLATRLLNFVSARARTPADEQEHDHSNHAQHA
jgi:hypothetical protein